jgi:hypothetical protein
MDQMVEGDEPMKQMTLVFYMFVEVLNNVINLEIDFWSEFKNSAHLCRCTEQITSQVFLSVPERGKFSWSIPGPCMFVHISSSNHYLYILLYHNPP